MRDFVPNGTGNSRYLKSNIPSTTTLAQLISMFNNGTFPVDFNGINNAGVAQIGDPLSKANLLPDNVVSTLGLPQTNPQLKDAFQSLGEQMDIRSCVKLMEMTTSVDVAQVDIDLSDIDLSLYAELNLIAQLSVGGIDSNGPRVQIKVNNDGGYKSALDAASMTLTDYIGYVDVQPTGGVYAEYYAASLLHLKILGTNQSSNASRVLTLYTYGSGPSESYVRHAAQIGLVKFAAGSAGLQSLNFLCDAASSPIIAGTKFIIYGVKA